jgi:hypothetical protein
MNLSRALFAMTAVAVVYLGATGILLLLARLGMIPWWEATEFVQTFSALASLGVGGVIGIHLGSGPS